MGLILGTLGMKELKRIEDWILTSDGLMIDWTQKPVGFIPKTKRLRYKITIDCIVCYLNISGDS